MIGLKNQNSLIIVIIMSMYKL